MTMKIDNPCYHCYRGAIGECIGCKQNMQEYSGDLESETIEIDEMKLCCCISDEEAKMILRGADNAERK